MSANMERLESALQKGVIHENAGGVGTAVRAIFAKYTDALLAARAVGKVHGEKPAIREMRFDTGSLEPIPGSFRVVHTSQELAKPQPGSVIRYSIELPFTRQQCEENFPGLRASGRIYGSGDARAGHAICNMGIGRTPA